MNFSLRITQNTWCSSARHRQLCPNDARDGFDRGFKVIVIADAGTAIPLNGHGRDLKYKDTPEGYGQYWEFLRNIEAQYAEVMSSDEFVALLERSSA